MRIAFNARFGAYDFTEGYGRFVREIAVRMRDYGLRIPDSGLPEGDPGLRPKGHPSGNQHAPTIIHHPPTIIHHPPSTILFLTDKLSEEIPTPSRKIGFPARHPLLWKLWYDLHVPRALRDFKADVFFSPDGICSLRTRLPQVLVIHDLAFLHAPGGLPWAQQRYYRRNTPLFVRKAKRIITVSEFSKQDILQHYPHAANKIDVVYNGVEPAFQPLSWEERESIRAIHTGGVEYFVYVGSIHPRKNLVNLLKAFSIFKKRQRTQMKLVIAGRLAWKHEGFTEALSRYKFREDVVLTGYLERDELRKLLGAAYALVNPSRWEGFGLTLVEAMQSGVPVLCSGTHVFPEIAADAAFYFNPEDPEEIAKQLMRVYIDETERSRIIEKGRVRAGDFSWERSASQVLQILHQAAGIP
jgi:glycosyltransferase involved in cell wall biosynthesis